MDKINNRNLIITLGWGLCLSFFAFRLGNAAVLPQPSRSGDGIRAAYVKTNFSCEGRPSGYYADVDTGCELYHMCDELGRKFSYACPNTTLFQQRMLVCDHWFMVNCSKAEDDYSANLLIGQKDKPFVSEGENVERTPRPDLKDRPYSADYSGESFRRHYKHHIQTQSGGTTDAPEYAPIHWETSNKQSQNREIPAETPTQATAESQAAAAVNGLRIFQTPVGFSKPEIVQSVDVSSRVQIPSSIMDLPNQYPDFTQAQADDPFPSTTPTIAKQIHLSPSAFAKAFEANPFQFKSKEHNDVSKQFRTKDTEAVAQLTSTTARIIYTPSTTQTPPPTPPTPPPTTTTTTTKRTTFMTTSTTTTTELPPPVSAPAVAIIHPRNPTNPSIPEPIDGLQPPNLHYKTYDSATTEGPPIYYQWKWAVPAFVLEPPKLNDPSSPSKDEKTPTARSVDSSRTTANSDSGATFNPDFFKKTSKRPEHNYVELRKSLAIPTFEFPLEEEGRGGLTNGNAVNSYQLKIPALSSQQSSWYGENKDCPECHPAFLQPGTCEPCVKR